MANSGPGTNGGDALVCATVLHQSGAAVEVCMPVEVKPDDAQWALATVMMKQRQYAQALPHLEIAARLKPNDADIQTNLGVVLAMQSDFAGAIRAFERALEINPNEGVAKQNLERARKQLESSGSGPRTR